MTNVQHSRERIRISSNFLVKMLVSYMVVAMIPLLLFAYSYRTGLDKITELEKTQLAAAIERSCIALNNDIEKRGSLISAMLRDDDLMALCRCANPLVSKQNVNKVLKAQKSLSVIGLCDGLYSEMFVYNIMNEFLVSTSSIYLKMSLVPGALAQTFRDSEWTETLLDTARQQADYSSKWIVLPDSRSGKAALLYMHPLYSSNTRVTSTYLLMLITPEKLESYLQVDESISMTVLDINGDVVAGASGVADSVDATRLSATTGIELVSSATGEDYFVTSRPISCAGLSVVAALPYTVVQARVAPLHNSFLLTALLVILTTLALCIGFAVINTRPIDNILVMLFGASAKELPRRMGNWQTLDATIRRLIDDNYQLKCSIKLQADYLKANMYYELLSDWQGNGAQRLIPRLRELDLDIDGEFMLVSLLFRAESQSESQTENQSENHTAMSMTLHAFVQNAFPCAYHITETDAMHFAALIPSESEEQVSAQLDEMKQRAADILDMGLVCVVDSVSALENLGRVSWEHSRTMELIIANERSTQSESSGQKPSLGAYPNSLDAELSSAILSGDERLLNSTLDKLWIEVCAYGKIPNVNLKLYIERCRMTIAQTTCRCPGVGPEIALSVMHQLRYYNRLDSFIEQIEQMKQILSPVMHITAQRAGSSLRRARITTDILDYMKEHFCDAEMCLGNLAEKFSMDEGYISSLIKLETGLSFQAYLEKLRVDRACELLQNGNKVRDVATMVGYNSPGNFRRAFSKVVGTTPSNFGKDSNDD